MQVQLLASPQVLSAFSCVVLVHHGVPDALLVVLVAHRVPDALLVVLVPCLES